MHIDLNIAELVIPAIFLSYLIIQKFEEVKMLFNSLDAQDATNFVLAYFTFAMLNKSTHSPLSTQLSMKDYWMPIPYLSLFQILRKPDSFKKAIRPIRVGLAPISIVLTCNASIHQITTNGVISGL